MRLTTFSKRVFINTYLSTYEYNNNIWKEKEKGKKMKEKKTKRERKEKKIKNSKLQFTIYLVYHLIVFCDLLKTLRIAYKFYITTTENNNFPTRP